jgi:ribose transport system substrate-binding protein
MKWLTRAKRPSVLAVVSAAAVAAGLTGGCGSSGSAGGASGSGGGGAGGGDKKYKISLIVGLKGDDFYGSLACGAKRAAEHHGASLDVQGPSKWDAPEQISVLNSVIAARPDAILIAPVDDTALQAPLEQAKAQGIKIVLVDTTLKNPEVAESQVTTDDEAAGRTAAQEVIKETGGKGSVVTINTQPGVSTVAARVRGFESDLKKSGGGLSYLGQQYSGDDAGKAASTVTASLAAHPNLSAVFTTNTLTGQGAATGIKNARKTGKIKLVGFDANPSGVQALQEGSAQAQVVLKPLDIGYMGFGQAINSLSGKPVQKMIRTGSLIASKDNLNSPDVQKYLYREACTG